MNSLNYRVTDLYMIAMFLYYQSQCESEVFEHFTMICSRTLCWPCTDDRADWVHSDNHGIFRPCQSCIFLHARANWVLRVGHGILQPWQSGNTLHGSCNSVGSSHEPDNAIVWCTVCAECYNRLHNCSVLVSARDIVLNLFMHYSSWFAWCTVTGLLAVCL